VAVIVTTLPGEGMAGILQVPLVQPVQERNFLQVEALLLREALRALVQVRRELSGRVPRMAAALVAAVEEDTTAEDLAGMLVEVVARASPAAPIFTPARGLMRGMDMELSPGPSVPVLRLRWLRLVPPVRQQWYHPGFPPQLRPGPP
jgi:hypothetical protein